MASENLDLIKRLLLAFNRADFEADLDLVDPDVRVHPRPDEPGVKDVYTRHESMFEYAGNWYSQWDDYEIEPVSFRDAPRDRVLVGWPNGAT